MKYKILYCRRCRKPTVYSKGIRSKCESCGKRINEQKCLLISECEKPEQATYLLKTIKAQLARDNGVILAKGANYINAKED